MQDVPGSPVLGCRAGAGAAITEFFIDNIKIVKDAPTADFFGHPRSDRAQLFLSKILQH